METVVKPNDDGTFLVAISGAINEYSQQPLKRILLQLAHAKAIEIDMGHVDVINSIGTIYWIEILANLLKIAPVTLSNCSITTVDYMNRLPAMTRGAQVSSIQIPYRCPQCRRIFSHFITAEELKVNSFPDVSCDKCSTPSEPEVDFEDYTAFLHHEQLS